MTNSIAVVTDSTADIPKELAEQYDIHVVPNLVLFEGKSLEDGKEISREEFYNLLPNLKDNPTTATASPGTYEKLYNSLIQGGKEYILSIHASSLLSGIFNAAKIAAQSFAKQILVIDSEQISMGLGFQVLTAAESIAHGLSLSETLERIKHVQEKIRVIAMLDTLEYIRRSGRVSWARARLGNLLNIKPFIELSKGKVFSLGEVRTRRRGIAKLKNLLKSIGSLERLAILHTNAENDAAMLNEEIKQELGVDALLVHVTTVIGTHVGPKGIGFAAVTR